MLEFIRLLRTRYQAILNHRVADDAQTRVYNKVIYSLTLAEASLQKAGLVEERPDHPIQIVLLGPTQAGKSTFANLLLDSDLAGVSPLAGYTVHPQGFCFGETDHQLAWLEKYFSPFRRCALAELNPDQLDYFAVSSAVDARDFDLTKGILWDTPDFDSINAEDYRAGVLRAIALADVIVLIVSKDKYADQSVWDMMALLESLNQPTLVCVNKMTESAKSIVVGSLLEKWHSMRKDAPIAVHTLSYVEVDNLADALSEELLPILADIKKAGKKVNRKHQLRSSRALIKQYWSDWIDPVKAEHQCMDQWNLLIDHAIEDSLSLYNRDYLEHSQHNETFQKALAELLTLLEVPGFATAFNFARRIVTWPVRQIMRIGKSAGGHNQNGMDDDLEVKILQQICDHFLIRLSESVIEQTEENIEQANWWRELGDVLYREKSGLSESFRNETKAYQLAFQPEIERAAQSLYEKLESQPALLNSLRATRITTDAAAVALAVKTGGIGMQDFVITPAVLSLTSLLTESALGGFMKKTEKKLQKSQLQTVRARLFEGLLKQRLSHLPNGLDQSDKFSISQTALSDAETQLKDKRHGLRFF